MAVVFALSTLLTAHYAEAQPSLVGKWKLVRMSRGPRSKRITDRYLALEFKKSGKFVNVMRYRGESISHSGRWTVRGNTLTTTTSKHTQVVTFKVNGSNLRLTRPGTQISMHFRRVK